MRIDDAKRTRNSRPNVALAAAIVAWNATPVELRGPHPSVATSRAHGSPGLATAYANAVDHRLLGKRVREAGRR